MSEAPTKKESKVVRLTRQLAEAEAALLAAQERLQPQIDEAQKEIDELREAHNKANRKSSKSYDALKLARSECRVRLGIAHPHPNDNYRKEYYDALKAFAVEKGFPLAEVGRLAWKYAEKLVDADEVVRTYSIDYQTATKECERAHRKRNIAEAPGGKLAMLRHELGSRKNTVEQLKKELQKLPRRNEAARDRRREEKEEANRDKDTAGALAVIDEFVWPNSVGVDEAMKTKFNGGMP